MRIIPWALAGLFLSAPPAHSQVDAVGDAPFMRVVEEEEGRIVRLEMGVHQYRRVKAEGPALTVAGAVHIADQGFYTRLQEILDGNNVVLYESVRPSGSGRDTHETDPARIKQTQRRLRFLAAVVHKARAEAGELPASLDEVARAAEGAIAELIRGSLADAWGNPIELLADPSARDGFDLRSLGADGVPGGDDLATDIYWSAQKPLSRAERAAAGGEKGGLQAQLAEALGLVFQLEGMSHDRPNWRNSDLSLDEVQDRLESSGADGGTLFRVLDGSSFSARLVGILVRLIGLTESSRAMTKLMLIEMLGQADKLLASPAAMGGAEMEGLMKVIIEDRNRVVIDDLAAIIEGEPGVATVGIIYGAGHLPDLIARLREMGYEPSGVEWITAMEVDVRAAGLTVPQARQLRQSMTRTIQRQLERGR